MTCPSLFAQSNYQVTAGWVCGADAASDARINGWVLDLRVYNLTTGGTYALGIDSTFPRTAPYNTTTAANLTLTVTSSGYDNTGTAASPTRTLYGTLPVRQPYPNQATNDEIAASNADACSGDTVPASYVDIRIALSDFVYSTDTSLTLNATAGIYTQGGHGTLAVSSLSIANNASTAINACSNVSGYPANCSAAKAPLPVCRWAMVPYQQVQGSSFNLEVVCFDRHYKQGLPVAAVKFSVSDAHSNSVTYTITKPTISTSTSGDQGKVQAYIATVSTSSLTQSDALTCNFIAYPWVGTLLDSSSTSGPIVTAALNAGGSGYAVSDTGFISGSSCSTNAQYKVLTLSSTAVATFAITYGGYGCATTSAATTTTGGPQPGSGSGFKANTTVLRGVAGNEDIGPLMMLNDKNSSYGQACAVVDPTNGHASGANTWVAANCSTLETNYNGGNTNSYTTVGYAIQALKSYNNANNGHNDPGGGRVHLITANHTLDSIGSDQGSQKAWVVIEPFTSASPVIIRGANSTMHTELIEYNGIALNDSGCSGGTCDLFVGTAATDRLWINNLAWNHTGGSDPYNYLEVYATNTTATGVNSAGWSHFSTFHSPWALIRGNVLPSGGTVCSTYAILATKNCILYPYEQSQSTSGAVNANSQALSDGIVFAFNSLFNSTSANNNYWRNSGTNGVLNYGAAFVENVWEAVSSAAAPALGIDNDATSQPSHNVMLWNNDVIGQRINAFYNDGTDSGDSSHVNWFAENQESIVGNLFASFNSKTDTFATNPNGARTGNWSIHYHVGSVGNWILQCVGSPSCTEGVGSGGPGWMGIFSGLYSNYNPAQVAGTDSNSYVVKLSNTAAAGNDPITGGSYGTYWTGTGNTGGDSKSTWTSGYIYNTLAFIHDYSYSTGTAAGNGNYRIYANSKAANLFDCRFEPMPYDLDGLPRWGGSGCSAGAYEKDPVLTPVFW